MGGPDPQKPVHTLSLQADHGSEQRRNAQQQWRQIPLPALRRIGLIRQAIKAGQPPLLLTHARVGAGGHIGRFAAHIYQLERLPAGFTVQQHGPQLHPDQHCGGGGKRGVLRLAADGVYSAVGRCHQHQQQRTQLAGHMMAPQFPECVLPHVHGQQNHKQQTTPRNAAAQHGVLPPEGGHVTQSVQYCRHDQGGNGHAHQCQGTPQMLGPALFCPKRLVAVRLRLRFRFRRPALRLRPQLLGVLPRLAAGTAAGQQALETLLQRERRLKDTVVVFRQHRVHRIMHHMFQRHAVRRQFLLRFRGRRRLGRLLRRRRTDHGKFSGVLPLLLPFSGFRFLRWLGQPGGDLLRLSCGDMLFRRRRRLGNRIRRRRRLGLGRLTPTLAVFGQDGLQRVFPVLRDWGHMQLCVILPVHSFKLRSVPLTHRLIQEDGGGSGSVQ